jgi:hypothetical protein
MSLKITLITPPDIFENDNESIFLINLNEEDQNAATDWLSKYDSEKDLNIYFYQGEINMPWFLHAMAVSTYKYIDIDANSPMTDLLAGYILGKNNVYYKTAEQNTAAVYNYINPNRVSNVVIFFERAISEAK